MSNSKKFGEVLGVGAIAPTVGGQDAIAQSKIIRMDVGGAGTATRLGDKV